MTSEPRLTLPQSFQVVVDLRPHPRPHSIDAANLSEALWWLPSLGPTSVLALHLLVHADGAVVTTGELAWQLGIMPGTLAGALSRLRSFRSLWIDRDGFHPVRYMPPVKESKLEVAPPWWRDAYEARP